MQDISYKDNSRERFDKERITHWDKIAQKMDSWTSWGTFYKKRMSELYRLFIPPGQKVLELGCGRGDFLAELEPSLGVGIDFSSEMINRAKERHPDLTFIHGDVHDLKLDQKFDFVILTDLINDLWDVQTVFERILPYTTSRTRIIMNFYSRMWEPILNIATALGLATKHLYQNWLTYDDVENLLDLAGYEIIRHQTEILFPLPPKFIANFFNKFLVRFWPFKLIALTNLLIARPRSGNHADPGEPVVSVIVPARNEAGNIPTIFKRVPEMGKGTEIVFVEGHSKDDTYQVIEEQIKAHPERNCKLFQQTGVGKGDAVRVGFANASGDVLMILDADLTVPPEDLPRFYQALVSGKGELVNGVRLVYPMEKEAMRFFNLVGNKFFSMAFSWLLGQSIKDTLCGTKVLWKQDYDKIAANRAYFGEFDPFGDFDLIFNSAKLNMKIIDIPIRYRERVYGDTNIDRWRHGWLLLKMLVVAARKLKFI